MFNENIKELKKQIPTEPSYQIHIQNAVAAGDLQLKSHSEIIQAVIKKVQREILVQRSRYSERGYTGEYLQLDVADLIEIPKTAKQAIERYKKIKKSILEEIKKLEEKRDSLELRIQLASNSTIDPIIEEVDGLGKLSLFSEDVQKLLK